MIHNVFEFLVTVEMEMHREGDVWVATCPALNVASHGVSEAEAHAMLREALAGFFECCAETGVLQEALKKVDVVSALPATLAATERAAPAAAIPERVRVPVNLSPAHYDHAVASQTAVY